MRVLLGCFEEVSLDSALGEILIGHWTEHGVADEAADDIVPLGHGLLPMPYWEATVAASASAPAGSVALGHEARRANS